MSRIELFDTRQPGQPVADAIKLLSAFALSALVATVSVTAQESASRLECEDSWGWRGRAQVCEIRELTVPATGSLSVDGGRNGGVRVSGSDRNDVLVRAKVQAWGDDEQEARDITNQVRIVTDDVIRAEGPSDRGRGWSVSYEVFTPRRTDLRLETHNGGIAIEEVSGDLSFEALNGGIRLSAISGNVRGRTTNGGIDATLTGSSWDGDRLELRTTNGGVRLRIPSDYSANLETATVNGGTNIDFPVTVQGRIGREVSATLGQGGPLIRVTTTNGGVRVSRY